jgi:hypothetical protein
MLLQSLRALCKAPGRPARFSSYFDELVRATGVSRRFAYGFRSKLHFADEGWPGSDRKLCPTLYAPNWKADKRRWFQAGAPAKEHCITSIGHSVAVESSQVVLVVSPLHHNSDAHLAGTTQCPSEAQHCKTISHPCSITDWEWNHNHQRTGRCPLEHQVGGLEWHASGQCASDYRWIY